MRTASYLSAFFACSIVVYAVGAMAQLYSQDKRPSFQKTEIQIERAENPQEPLKYQVELAQTPEQQSYGLMFVKNLPANTGMIFRMSPKRAVSFWMKNTFIPLDILFIAPNNKIRKIANGIPHDQSQIFSEGEVAAVLELNAGEAARQGILVGDRVLFNDN